MNGKVYIIGGGCGSWDLITVRGFEKLKTVDAIVYDDLINKELLTKCENTELFYMGKRAGCHSAPQEEINKKLVELAKDGKIVARLKGGDPFVFGRGGEEIAALEKEGIDFEYIPGVSSSIAIPGLEGIPVTSRNISRGFMVVTGHSASGNEDEENEMIKSMAGFSGTIVILMGLGRISHITSSLISKGKSPFENVAVISGGNSNKHICVKGTLENISEKVKQKAVEPPAIIIIGKTVEMFCKGE